jgi:hypothetical protein
MTDVVFVGPGRRERANPEIQDSGFDAAAVIGRAFARPGGIAPE